MPSLDIDDAINKIATSNNIENANLIVAGEKLTIPDASATVTSQNTVAQSAIADVNTPVQNTVSVPVAPAPVTNQAVAETAVQAQSQAAAAPVQATPVAHTTSNGSTYDQFIAAGGTASMWNTIVIPESGGNPNAVSPAGYRGLGQTKQGWGSGSVNDQTKGMVNYATSRYGSVDNAVQFRNTHGWW